MTGQVNPFSFIEKSRFDLDQSEKIMRCYAYVTLDIDLHLFDLLESEP